MNIGKFLDSLDFMPDKEEVLNIKKETSNFLSFIREEIKRQRIFADVILGGSFAKGTMVKKDIYDVDIFVRFDWKYESLSEELEKIIKNVCKKIKATYKRQHGSRDYFRIQKKSIVFEVIPVLKIKHPGEARNVTDLSYFHVNYVKNNINDKLKKEIALAKTFCRAQGVYGAESYIQGFSGYGLECLIIHYKSFERMIRALVKLNKRLIIDSAKKYKKPDDVLFSLNESKLHSPIVLIDPTWKERNVLAALNHETFKKFQDVTEKFLKNPDVSYFEIKEIDKNKLKDIARMNKAEFVHLQLKTKKQAGDIAGTKLKKFSNFLIREISRYFEITKSEFEYGGRKIANLYIAVKSKKEIVRIGPPVNMIKNVKEFKKRNKNTFVKNGMVHAKIKINFSARRFINDFKKENKKKIMEMNIFGMKVN